ncbi:fanconi-associated nuclease 1 homolog isoform X2 [Selaginella moellendorffii]|uniref:fanconi-associated nuclease 1 homolog isoform X2 n=1 Tax=Selaginella moellendorffii TaxID=88036 RepID=UPI000D1C97FC|nr:fanconi-associated nuclease 1 homolog isoform X2 [Selaginella moellendorffii]|eukprot:XP_024518087.1 fanconi-associated nuclease 1 homolog isoform X2 [Selaginella moellendorffii]
MLRGRESLIRLVGKRQRNVSLPARVSDRASISLQEELECGDVSLEIKGGLSLACCDWVECPVCGKQIRGNELLVNCHLDTCLQRGKKKKNSVQHTLFHFNLSKKVEYEESGNCVLEIQQSPPLETGVDCNTAAGSPEPEVSSTLECFEEPDVANSVLPAELNSETRDLYNGCLEARIAGRKYHRDVECQAGMRVHLVREPENPMDTYAVKVLTADGLSLGHIPKELSRYLSPLMEKGVVDVQGYVSKSTSEAARLKLDLREIQSRTIGSLSEEKVLAVKWSRLMDAADKGQDHGCRYQQNFLYMLQVVLERDLHLFTSDEIELLEAFRSISSDGQRLFVRLAQRKGPWFRLQNIFYEDIGDTNSAVHELVEGRYLVFDADVNSSELLEHLTVQELKDLAVNSKIMIKSATLSLKKIQLITAIRDALISLHFNLTALIREATGPCIRIAETVEVLLWRLQRLFFLNGEQEFHVFLLVDIGRIKYPSYRCARTMPVFASREDFLAYEQALQLAQVVDMSLEAGNSEAVNSSFRKARTTLELINAHTEIKHPFLARFSAAWVYATICTVAASFLEKERRYAEAINLFKQLLSMQYCPGRRGYWTLRLSIDLEHLQRLEESLLVAENGLNDFSVRGGDRIALQRRVLRLGKPPRRWKVPPYAALLKKKQKVTIMGRPLNNANGMKSRFYGYDGQQCSVEDLALQYYAGEDGGGWKGVHSESGIWLTLFGLLMWDVIFSDVPDVFQTPFQTAPLDLCTDSFYPVRSSLIESRLQAIRDGGARQLVAETWAEHYGTSCSGVNWEKYSLEDLQTITVCIGGPGLSAICKLLAEDHSNWTAGMPDLLLWKEKEAKLAEVKGPGDRLSEQQVAWFLILSDANVPVELCKVSKTMNDRS